MSKIVFNACELRKNPSVLIQGKKFDRDELSSKLIPATKRKWEIPAKSISLRGIESATSFEKVVSCPLYWTLRYAVNVRPGNAFSIPNESLMLGTLGHKILELLILENIAFHEEVIERRTGELFDEWTPLLAAPLLELQNGIKRSETRQKLQKSIKQFFRLMNDLNIKITDTELKIKKTWNDDVEFEGTLDLVGETSTGRKVLIDAKYTNSSKRYKERLKTLSVQLTLYHWLLLELETEEELPVAYFMLKEGEFFTLPHEEIPSEYYVEGASILETNEILKNSIETVVTQMINGTVIASGIESADESSEKQESDEENFEPIQEPSCKYCEFRNLCGKRRMS